MTGQEIAYLYMYTTTSPFNVLSMNEYMTSGQPIVPISADAAGNHGNGSFVNASCIALNIIGNGTSSCKSTLRDGDLKSM